VSQVKDFDSLWNILQKKHQKGHFKSVTFTQKNIHYSDKDSIVGTSTWKEYIEFPNKFRIDLDSTGKNIVLFRNDSVYHIRNGKLRQKEPYFHDFLAWNGGIYFMNKEDARQKFTKAGYDLTKFHVTTWQNKKIYVIGALEDDFKSPQAWFDAQTLLLVRIFSWQGRLLELQFNKHKKMGKNGWIETEVITLQKDKIVQLEEYYDIVTSQKNLDKQIFELIKKEEIKK
jgi:outer membrane lipoprotein-sorting protein